MASEPTPQPAGSRLDTGTRLAYDRTFLAHERTQLAWVRTSLALISFGFGIAKFFQYLHEQRGEQAPPLGAATVGMLMITIGLVTLVIASVQHHRALQTLREQCPDLSEVAGPCDGRADRGPRHPRLGGCPAAAMTERRAA